MDLYNISASKNAKFLLFFLLDLLLFVVEENNGKDKDTSHHTKGGSVVRVGRYDEPFVLVMSERNHRNLIKVILIF